MANSTARTIRSCGLVLALLGMLAPASSVWATQPPPATTQEALQQPTETSSLIDASNEIVLAFVRLPLAAILGTALAFRPRRRSQGARKVVVVQTQIMLAVVGAVIMLVVGNSLSRAFGIVGAAGLIRYRSNIADPKDAVVMLCALTSGLAAGVGLYKLAAVATAFMMVLLWLIDYLEPPKRKRFEVRVKTTNPPDGSAPISIADFRPKAEDVLQGLGFDFELLVEDEDEIRYLVSAPVSVRTRDVSDTLRLVGGNSVVIRWEEKRLTP